MEVVHTVHTGAILQCAKIMVRRASAEVKYCLRMQVDYKLLEREVKEKLAFIGIKSRLQVPFFEAMFRGGFQESNSLIVSLTNTIQPQVFKVN